MLPKGISKINNELYVGSYSFKELQMNYGTPLYIYDKQELMYNIDTFNKYFKGTNFKSQIVYASKAFLVPKMCKIIDELDWMIDAVSLGDLYLIKESIPLSRVVFHGNNKSIEELTYAINNNVGIIVVDNYQELLLIEKLNKKKND